MEPMLIHGQKEPVMVLDRNLEEMLISAERYACGRRTYIVHDTVTYILGLLPFLSDWCIGVMLEDMKREFTMYDRSGSWFGLGDSCDIADWKYFRETLQNEQDRRKEEVK